MEGAKLVSSAILGYDIKTIMVGDRTYVIYPPTIHKISGAAYWLTQIDGEIEDFKDILKMIGSMPMVAKALSFLIQGDEELADELCRGTLGEVIKGIEEGFSLISTENFTRLSTLRRSAAKMIAKPSI